VLAQQGMGYASAGIRNASQLAVNSLKRASAQQNASKLYDAWTTYRKRPATYGIHDDVRDAVNLGAVSDRAVKDLQAI